MFKVSKDVKPDDEAGIHVKEQAILDLGALFSQTKKAKGQSNNNTNQNNTISL